MSIRWDCEKDGCYKDNCIPDWKWLEGLLPRGCRPTDIDGIVEIDNKFLVLEWKSHGAGLLKAQQMVFERLTVLSTDILVVIMYADTVDHTTLREIQFVYDGHTCGKVACTSSEFADRYKRWGGSPNRIAKEACKVCGETKLFRDGLCNACYWAEQGWQEETKHAVG
jgi:hypothetical protein